MHSSEWDEAHKSAGDSDGHFSAGNFLSWKLLGFMNKWLSKTKENTLKW